jgi:hypothetical protein
MAARFCASLGMPSSQVAAAAHKLSRRRARASPPCTPTLKSTRQTTPRTRRRCTGASTASAHAPARFRPPTSEARCAEQSCSTPRVRPRRQTPRYRRTARRATPRRSARPTVILPRKTTTSRRSARATVIIPRKTTTSAPTKARCAEQACSTPRVRPRRHTPTEALL